MSSPLNKRFPRELKNNFGKYLGMFLFMTATIALVSGFLASAHSITVISAGMHEKYHVEDGRFSTSFEISDDAWDAVEALGCTLYESYSHDVPMVVSHAGADAADSESPSADSADAGSPDAEEAGSANPDVGDTAASDEEITVRIYQTRTEVNLGELAEGSWPQGDSQIAIDRVFSQNSGVQVGDTVTVAGRDLTVSGICVLPDYTCLFENNTDFLFNAVTFCVAVVDEPLFKDLAGQQVTYTYSFVLDDRSMELVERTDLEDDMMTVLNDNDAALTDFVDWESNSGITYATEDVQGDSVMWEVMMFLLVAIMAFVFVILTSSTIEAESAAIGTFLASGYRKGELLRHYATMPTLVGLAAAIVGNALGYSLGIRPMQGLYYGSYSFPQFETRWSAFVFVITTVVPFVLLVSVTVIGLARKLNCTPIEFLRHETSTRSKRKGIVLPASMPFASRFRIRVFLKNIPNFATLFAGIFLGGVLLLFGFCLIPTIDSFAASMRESLVAEHTYMLKAPLELEGSQTERQMYQAVIDMSNQESIDEMSAIEFLSASSKAQMVNPDANPVNTQENSPEAIEQAEKYAVTSLQLQRALGGTYEDVTIYGIQENSRYWTDIDVTGDKVVFGEGLKHKCRSDVGVTQTLHDKYTGDTYDLVPSALAGNGTTMSIYMSIDQFNRLFGNDEGYFNGYVSNEPLAFDDMYLASDLQPSDMDKIGKQMRSSMGSIANFIVYLSVFIYLILMYLLTKTVIDGSARSISYMKVFGYRDREIKRFYVSAITICVLVSLVVSMPLVIEAISALVYLVFMNYSGNFVIQVPMAQLLKVMAMGSATYAAVALFHIHRIKRVPMAIALKTEG